MLVLAVADIRYKVYGTPFSEELKHNINIQEFNMKFNYLFIDQIAIASFTKLSEKNFFPFQIIIRSFRIKSTYGKSNTVQTLQFPQRKSSLVKTENIEVLLTEIPQPQFLSKLKRYFCLIEILSENSGDSCTVLMKNTFTHMATLPAGKLVYLDCLLPM